MAVLAIFKGAFTKAQYEALRTEVKWETKLAPGGVFHACGFDAQGLLRVADVWESGEAMTKFVESRLLPGMKKLGITPPEVEVYPVHNVNAYPAIDDYRIG